LKFSYDSKFVAARREKNGEGTGITVYELPVSARGAVG